MTGGHPKAPNQSRSPLAAGATQSARHRFAPADFAICWRRKCTRRAARRDRRRHRGARVVDRLGAKKHRPPRRFEPASSTMVPDMRTASAWGTRLRRRFRRRECAGKCPRAPTLGRRRPIDALDEVGERHYSKARRQEGGPRRRVAFQSSRGALARCAAIERSLPVPACAARAVADGGVVRVSSSRPACRGSFAEHAPTTPRARGVVHVYTGPGSRDRLTAVCNSTSSHRR